MTIKFKKFDPLAVIPSRKHEHDSGMDLYSVEARELAPGERYTFTTGIGAEIPEGYELQVRPRSGLASKCGIVAILGTIDRGYKGEIRVILVNLSGSRYLVQVGDRIAQLVLARVELPTIEIVSELSQSDRGINGFGSTGEH